MCSVLREKFIKSALVQIGPQVIWSIQQKLGAMGDSYVYER